MTKDTQQAVGVLLTALVAASAVAAGVGTLGVGAAQGTPEANPGDANLDSDESFWQGQSLWLSAGSDSAGEQWRLVEVSGNQTGANATQFLLNQTGEAVVSTTGLDGRYAVVNAAGAPVTFDNGVAQGTANVSAAAFNIRQQTLNASFADDRVTNNDSSSSLTDLELASNRSEYNVTLSADGLTVEQLADIFPDATVQNGEVVVNRTVTNETNVLDANFTGVPEGDYEIIVATADGAGTATASISVGPPITGDARLANGSVVQQRGDVANFTVELDGTDQATVTLGSDNVNYVSQFTIVDENGDGEVTVQVNTYLAGRAPNVEDSGISVVGDDQLTDYELRTDPVPNRLDAASYPIQLQVGEDRTDVGGLLLTNQSFDGIQSWTAPDDATFDTPQQLLSVVSQDDTVAAQDWAVVQVQASGLYGYVENLSDLNNDQTGLSFNVTEDRGLNFPVRDVDLSQARLLIDEANNQLFVVFDSNSLNPGSEYTANFTVNGSNAYVPEGERRTLTTNFTVVDREVTFDNETLEVPSQSDVTVEGDSTLAPGTEFLVIAENVGENPFFERSTATVGPNGSWNATFDFSEVPAGTNFTVSAEEPSANVSASVVSGAGAAETTTAEETTTVEETPVGDEGMTETETETETETTTAAVEAVSHAGSSAVGVLLAFVAVSALAGVLVSARRGG